MAVELHSGKALAMAARAVGYLGGGSGGRATPFDKAHGKPKGAPKGRRTVRLSREVMVRGGISRSRLTLHTRAPRRRPLGAPANSP